MDRFFVDKRDKQAAASQRPNKSKLRAIRAFFARSNVLFRPALSSSVTAHGSPAGQVYTSKRTTMAFARSRDLAEPASLKRPEVDPNISLRSVEHLIPTRMDDWREAARCVMPSTPLPAPAALRNQSVELRELRREKVWETGTLKQQVQEMEQLFPDISAKSDRSVGKQSTGVIQRRDSATDMPNSKPARFDSDGRPVSDIGLFTKLPGELRNKIYCLAILENEAVKFEMGPQGCSYGPCAHVRVINNAPGISETCRQMRFEVMPIFCVENTAFQFDARMVKERCVSNFINSMGDYADLVGSFKFMMKRPIWDRDQFQYYADYIFTLDTPDSSTSFFKLTQSEAEGRKVCQCKLDRAVASLNAYKKKFPTCPNGMLAETFANSEELGDFVWRMHKSRQWMAFLDKCNKCKEVVFNY